MSASRQVVFLAILAGTASAGLAQELGGAGTVQGTVKDPTGGVMQAVDVKISNPRLGLTRTSTTDAMGKYVFRNLPPNPYHISVAAQGFRTLERDVDVRTAVPIDVDLTLALAGETAAVQVVGHAEDLLERDPTAHTDIDQSLIDRLPLASSGRPQSGHHAGVAGRRGGLQRLLPSGRRSRPDAVLD